MDACNFLKFFILLIVFHNTLSGIIPEYLQECYLSEEIVNNENKLPKNMFTFIEILRKIERDEHYSMSLKLFSSSLLHRFRSDGIKSSLSGDNRYIIPYYVGDYMQEKLNIIKQLVPGNIEKFPNDSLSQVERCSLHSMVSTNVHRLYRGDESSTCKVAKGIYQRRYLREIRDGECPTEDGAVLTKSGTLNIGSVLVGIASAELHPQSVVLKHLLKNNHEIDTENLRTINRKLFSTITGDLAEVTLKQGPSKIFTIGITGNWNSTIIPKWYFLSDDHRADDVIHYELTAAELKGGMDGLILSDKIVTWYKNYHDLRLSQVFDMYYNFRGLFDVTVNACNRYTLFNNILNVNKLEEEILAASLCLADKNVVKVSFPVPTLKTFSNNVFKEFTRLMAEETELTSGECKPLDNFVSNTPIYYHPSVDLTIFLDTSWSFDVVQKLLVNILEEIEVGQYNSNFTIFNAKDGSIIVNTTNSILDFYALFNASYYERQPRGIDMSKIFAKLEFLQPQKLNSEKNEGLGGQKSDVVLIMPYGENNEDLRQYHKSQMERIKREVPDCVLLIYVYKAKDKWPSFVSDPETDLFSLSTGQEYNATADLTSRIKQIPKRLFNSRCGAYYRQSGQMRSYDDYIQPFGVNFYRLHPNYFFTYDSNNPPRIKVRISGSGSLEICESRDVLNIKTLDSAKSSGIYCRNITSETFDRNVLCPYEIYYIMDCKPYYLSIRAINAPVYSQCSDKRYCRYPDMIKYTISYENLVCKSSATSILFAPIFLVFIAAHYFL